MFIFKHQEKKHDSKEPMFTVNVTKVFKDCLTQQICEEFYIWRSEVKVINSKTETFTAHLEVIMGFS